MNVITLDKMPAIPGGHFFNEPNFHALKEEAGLFYALEENGQIKARVGFYLKGHEAVSGYKAPFGSIDRVEGLRFEKLQEFVDKVIADLGRRGVKKVSLSLPPAYMQDQKEMVQLLENKGFSTTAVEVNQHLLVDHVPFTEKISQKERNKLNRARVEGYRVERLTTKDIPPAFELIMATHKRKNYPVTLDEAALKLAFEQIPERYLLIGLYDEDILIAVVGSVLVSEKVMYNFYHADHEDYRSRSPLVTLIGESYKYCLENQLKILDLGVSSVEGKLNEGLFRFKKNLGCIKTEKKILAMNLLL